MLFRTRSCSVPSKSKWEIHQDADIEGMNIDIKNFHKFHHRYNKIVVPSTANAVSTLECILAYMLPFVLCSIVTRPSRSSLVQAACVVSVCNIFVHTPFLRGVSQRLPWFVVSTHDHFDHHNKQKTNFAAPTLNIDRIFRHLVSFHHH